MQSVIALWTFLQKVDIQGPPFMRGDSSVPLQTEIRKKVLNKSNSVDQDVYPKNMHTGCPKNETSNITKVVF